MPAGDKIIALSANKTKYESYISKQSNIDLASFSLQSIDKLIEDVTEIIDYGEFLQIDSLFAFLLTNYASLEVHSKVNLFKLSLKATNFVKKLFNNFLCKNMNEKHGFNILETFDFKANLGDYTLKKLIKTARAEFETQNKELKLVLHCLLESFGIRNDGKDNTMFFISYTFAEDKSADQILINWSEKVYELAGSDVSGDKKDPLDALLYLESFFISNIFLSDFFANEIRYLSNYELIEKIILNLKSHKIFYKVFTGLLFKSLDLKKDLAKLFVSTFTEKYSNYTKKILDKGFSINPEFTERLFKNLIIKKKPLYFCEYFYRRCKIIDSDFIESCITCKENLHNLDKKILDVLNTHYLSLLASEYSIFEELIKMLKNYSFPTEKIVEKFFNDYKFIDKQFLKRFLIFSASFKEESRKYILKIFLDSFRNLKICYVQKKIVFRQENLKSIRIPVEGEYAKYFFEAVSLLKSSHEILEFCYLFIFMDQKAFLDCLFSETSAANITFFVRCADEIYKNKIFKNDLYEDFRLRLLKSHFMIKDNYWCTAVRKRIEKCFEEFSEKKAREFLEKKNYNYLKFTETRGLIKNYLKCDDPELSCIISDILDERERYEEGLAFNDSYISIKANSKRFCLYSTFYQYKSAKSCNLFSLISNSDEGSVYFGIVDGKYFVKQEEDLFFLKSFKDSGIKKVFSIEMYGKKGTAYCGSNKHSFKVGKVKEIRIGESFKGVVSQILFYNKLGYSNSFLACLSKQDYFTNNLRELEKRLSYLQGSGIYIDTLSPYNLTEKPVEVYFHNVLCNKNMSWMKNSLVKLKSRGGKEVKIQSMKPFLSSN